MQRSPSQNSASASEQIRQQQFQKLLTLLIELDQELHPGRSHHLDLSVDSSLERDLAIDSLTRVELLYRLEHSFGVAIAEQTLMRAETVRDLLEIIHHADQGRQEIDRAATPWPETGNRMALPNQARTLSEVLDWHCRQHPQRVHMLLYESDETATPISYGELQEQAQGIARGLSAHDLLPGQSVAIMLPTSRDYFISFFGILLAGGVPVPIYPPVRRSQIEDHLRRHSQILANAQCQVLITSREIAPVARLLQAQVANLRQVLTTATLLETTGADVAVPTRPQDLAFLQYTSGSTGSPKGVMLSHDNLLANIRSMGAAVRVNADDVFVSWLPLYHDMGLIGAWLGSLYHACPLVVMSPLAFLSRPHRWLWAIHRHRGTISAAPNFAYELCLSKIDDSSLEGLDLSSWRLAFNGAEPVSSKTIRRFSERFASYGFSPLAMTPVYGLAESSVGLAFPPLQRGPLIDSLQRDPLEQQGAAIPAANGDASALEVVACGQPLRGHQVRIVDEQGRELPERKVGYLQFQGPSATAGYFRNPEATAKLFHGPWLDSGDLAYIAGGDIYLTGRVKDVIIRAGRNIYPQELEEAVGDLEGIRKGCVAVFGSKEATSGTERLVVLAETYSTDSATHQQLRERITAVAVDLTGVAADEVVLAPPHTVLKTSSGKVRRDGTRQRYEQGLLGSRQRSLWLQVTRLALSGLRPQWQRLRRTTLEHLYAGYAWLLFGIMAPLVWLLAALLPAPSWRWAVTRQAARLITVLAGIKLLIRGTEHLHAAGPAIVVSNHASYLDGLLLMAALPVRFRFVAKREFLAKPIPRIFLQRIGTLFVDRFDPKRSQDDLAQLHQIAARGDSLLFFPEGTFSRMPGLLPFRMGAFVTAGENDLPVVPVTIRGSRSLLRSDSWFPRRVMISLFVSAPIRPTGKGWEATVALRDQVRTEILKWSGEPDLAGESVMADNHSKAADIQ